MKNYDKTIEYIYEYIYIYIYIIFKRLQLDSNPQPLSS